MPKKVSAEAIQAENAVAVGTLVTRRPPPQIPASGTALGSYLR